MYFEYSNLVSERGCFSKVTCVKIKNFHTSFKEINDRYNHTLRGLETHLKAWLGDILFSNHTAETKVKLWKNTLNHFLGNHSDCLNHGPVKQWKNKNNAIAIQGLKEVITFWLPTVEEFIRGQTTNYNEVFHSIKARFLNKNYNYGDSSVTRICASICQYNEGYRWILNVLKRIHMKILPYESIAGVIGFLKNREKTEKKKMEKIHRNPEETKKRNRKKRKDYQQENNTNPLKH